MPFREKTAWISLLSITGIYSIYFWSIFTAGSSATRVHFANLLGTVIALVVVQVALTIAAARTAPKDAQAPRDERERLIDLKATRTAYAGLATAVALACIFGALDPPIVFNTNSLLLVLVTTELLRAGSQIIQYRRGA